MKQRLILTVLLLAMLTPHAVFAIDNVSAACTANIYEQMSFEQRFYRSVLFGQKKVEDLPIGGVIYSDPKTTWIKTKVNEWKSLSQTWDFSQEKFPDPLTDEEMQEKADIPERRGIMEIRKAQTSDLLPPLIQSLRALQCKLKAVCEAARMSIGKTQDDASTLTVQTDGCIEFTMPVFDGCREQDLASMNPDSCHQVVVSLINQEGELLRLLATYDAAYRSLMQFAGTFDGFLTDFRFPLLQPLWQMIRAIGALDSIPCFQGQCNE